MIIINQYNMIFLNLAFPNDGSDDPFIETNLPLPTDQSQMLLCKDVSYTGSISSHIIFCSLFQSITLIPVMKFPSMQRYVILIYS